MSSIASLRIIHNQKTNHNLMIDINNHKELGIGSNINLHNTLLNTSSIRRLSISIMNKNDQLNFINKDKLKQHFKNISSLSGKVNPSSKIKETPYVTMKNELNNILEDRKKKIFIKKSINLITHKNQIKNLFLESFNILNFKINGNYNSICKELKIETKYSNKYKPIKIPNKLNYTFSSQFELTTLNTLNYLNTLFSYESNNFKVKIAEDNKLIKKERIGNHRVKYSFENIKIR